MERVSEKHSVTDISALLWNWPRVGEVAHRKFNDLKSLVPFSGVAHDFTAHQDIIFPNEDRFVGCIELGVRDLVGEIVFRWGLVTYSSCEGHEGSDRYVGIICGNRDEYRSTWQALALAAELSNIACSEESEAIVVSDIVSDGRITVPSIRLGLFHSHSSQQSAAALANKTKSLIQTLGLRPYKY